MGLLFEYIKNNRKTVVITIIAFIAIVLVKVFTGPPPPGMDTWGELFNRKSNLPEQIKRHPVESRQVLDVINDNIPELSEEEINLLSKLTEKAMMFLPIDEQIMLNSLHDRFNENGYDVLNKDEIKQMQELNKKAYNLLPENDQRDLSSILQKMQRIVEDK